MNLLKCLKCGTKLDVHADRCVCQGCGSEWPVKGGIPRFFQLPTYYWGEVSQNEARDMLAAARKEGWAEAVRARFPENDGMIIGLLDPQRASWAPMLGLDEQSRVLDVGSGYGAITHSLSRFAGEVYSVEAIPERIEFTRERLRQEDIKNVTLIQASAIALPFVEKSFDAVIVNGVLEWVGEWDLEGDPRSIQLRFLSMIQRLLKDDGRLLVGIENRFGYGLYRGTIDHSGIPYTSLVPRRVATLMIRRSRAPHHRTKLNVKKEYRTYTYSKRGYQKLLKDAGFSQMSCYWAKPGYNQPFHLIPLAMPRWMHEELLQVLDHPSPFSRRSWRRIVKRMLARPRLLRFFVPDFVLIASKQAGQRTNIGAWIEEQLATRGSGDKRGPQSLNWALYTRSFAQKSIVRLATHNGANDVAILKVRVRGRNTTNRPQHESANGSKVQGALRQVGTQLIGVPQVISELQVGNVFYSLESAAQGVSLAALVRQPDYFKDLQAAENDFATVVTRTVELTRALQNVRAVEPVDSRWLLIEPELNSPETRTLLGACRYFAGSGDTHKGCVQHADFTVENIFLDQQRGRIEVFDWGDLAVGYPPLYDFFSLFYSTGYLASHDDKTRFANEEDRWIASFKAIFLTDVGFAQTVQKLVLRAGEHLNVQPDEIPSLLLEFLLIRTHYYRNKSVAFHGVYQRLLDLVVARGVSVFGRFPLIQVSV